MKLHPTNRSKLALALVAVTAWSAASTRAADLFWSGGTGDYTNAPAWGGTVPSALDNAINDSGAANSVKISAGNPDWTVSQIRAGNSLGNGSFIQDAQVVTALGTNYNGPVISEFFTPFRLGIVAGLTGDYTLNGGSLNYGTGPFHVGEVGTGNFNLNGGTVTGTGLFVVNPGGIAVPNPAVVTGTAGHGPYLGDFTYYEQGYSSDHPTTGLPAAGSTLVSVTQGDHSYEMPPSYTANNAVILDAAVSNATITLTTPTALSALSFLGSAGNGPVTNNYTIHYASGASDTGMLIVPDWFGAGQEALNVEGRVDATGVNFQYPGTAGGNPVGNAPYLMSTDISLVNTDKVVSIDLTFAGGNGNQYATATLLAVSGQDVVGNPFTPLAIGGYNADVVVEATAPSPFVSTSVMDTVTQTGGTNTANQIWVGQGKNSHGTYNLSGGLVTAHDWTVVGRSGGAGVFNMTGGTLHKMDGGNFIIGSGAGNNSVADSTGLMVQSGGTIDCDNEYWIAENSLTTGTNNISGTAVLNLNNWLSIGRGGQGTVNFSGGTINKSSSGNFIVGDGGTAYFNQTGGTIVSAGELWIGQSGTAVGQYDLSAGAVTVNNWISIGRNGGNGTLNLTGGSLTKGGGGNFSIGGDGGATGTLNQDGGSITNLSGFTYLGQGGGAGTWSINGGDATLGTLQFCEGGNGAGVLNLNGGVIRATEINAGLDGANCSLFFNGGTLQALADNANFLHGLGGAYVMANNAVIDSQGFTIAIVQNIDANDLGGLTKLGSGTLVLSGTNSYIGTTLVNAGTLAVNSDTLATGDYSVASGAQLVVGAQALNAQLGIANLTLASGTPALGLDLAAFGNPTTAPLSVSGTLQVNGTVQLNLTDTLPHVGQIPLISYGTKSGAGSFALGSMPLGVTATISNNVANHSIDLVISSVSSPRWDGQAGGTWDIGVTTNWVNLADGLPVVYNQGNTALFDDSAAGTKTVNLTTTVTPASVTFNDSVDYTLNGSGKISGTTSLTKSGSGAATIANTGGNDFTGPVTLSGGTLSVASLANGGSASAIGASSAAATNLLFNGGTLGYTGPATTIDRAYTVQAGGGAISNANDLTIGGLTAAVNGGGFTKTGAGQLAYTGVGVNALAGADYGVRAGGVTLGSPAGAQTNTVQGGFSVGGPVNATATLTNTTLTTSGNVDVGNVMDTVGTLTINSNATVNVGSWLTLGDGTNSTATMNLNGGTLNVNNGRLFLGSAPGTMSTLNINGGVINKSGDYFALVNGGWNGNDARTGVVNQVDGTVNSSSEMWIGDGGGAGNLSRGTYNLSGGTLTVNNWFGIGRDGASGVFNLSGGTLNKGVNGDMVIGRGGSFGKFVMTGGTLNKDAVNPLIVGQGGGVGELDQSGGTITTTGEYWLGVDNTTLATNNISGTASMTVHNWVTVGRNGTGVVNMSAGQFNSDSHAFIVGIWGGSQGFWNQSGGSLYVDNEIWIGQGDNNAYGTINLSGGTITNTSWLAVGREGAHGTLNITGGTMVKTGGGNISIAHNGGASGDVIISGTGTFICASGETWVGENAAPGTWTMNGGTAILGLVHLAQNADAQGLMILNGGSLTATEISTGNNGASQRELDFNGGTLVAGADNTNFIHDLSAANIMAGGAIIDSASYNVSVNQALTGAGDLTKQGTGTLNLNGANTYTGATLVNAGTLGGSGTIAGPVTVAAGAALAPGNSIGTLTINNTLTLAAGSTVTAEVSLDGTPTNDVVTGLTGVTYAGTLVVNNVGASPLVAGTVFKLFNSTPAGTGNFTTVTVLPSGSATFNPATGEVTITSAGAPTVNPPVLTGGALILTGTGGTPGGSYNWISSTNVAAPVANWTTNVSGVFDGNGAFSNGISILPTEPARFFRLKTP